MRYNTSIITFILYFISINLYAINDISTNIFQYDNYKINEMISNEYISGTPNYNKIIELSKILLNRETYIKKYECYYNIAYSHQKLREHDNARTNYLHSIYFDFRNTKAYKFYKMEGFDIIKYNILFNLYNINRMNITIKYISFILQQYNDTNEVKRILNYYISKLSNEDCNPCGTNMNETTVYIMATNELSKYK